MEFEPRYLQWKKICEFHHFMARFFQFVSQFPLKHSVPENITIYPQGGGGGCNGKYKAKGGGGVKRQKLNTNKLVFTFTLSNMK